VHLVDHLTAAITRPVHQLTAFVLLPRLRTRARMYACIHICARTTEKRRTREEKGEERKVSVSRRAGEPPGQNACSFGVRNVSIPFGLKFTSITSIFIVYLCRRLYTWVHRKKLNPKHSFYSVLIFKFRTTSVDRSLFRCSFFISTSASSLYVFFIFIQYETLQFLLLL